MSSFVEVGTAKAPCKGEPSYRDFRAGDVRHSLADITRARTLLGYEPEYDVRQGLRLAGDWYDAHL